MSGKRLIIAEKPSVAMNISQAIGDNFTRKDGYLLGKKYVISWCVGHLVGLSEPEHYIGGDGKWNLKDLPIIPEKWNLTVYSATKQQYKILVGLIKADQVEDIVCATDAGREGELIFRYVYNTSKSKKTVYRLWVSSMEKDAILKGLSSMKPDSAYDNLFEAGFARARADWLIGMNATRLYTCRYGSYFSVGRVQTPTLNAIVKREEEIRNFVSTPFYIVGIKDKDTLLGTSERFKDPDEAQSVKETCDGKDAVVSSVKTEAKTQNPPKLFDLTSLQRQANKNFSYTASKTLEYTQSLYEKKLVTYPRTDSSYVTSDMEDTVRSLFNSIKADLDNNYGVKVDYEPNIKRVTNNKKVTDHHAIIPTKEVFKTDLSSLPSGEKNILRLVMQRFMCALGETRKTEVTQACFDVEGHEFKGKGTRVLDKGFLEAECLINKAFFNADMTDKDKPLPELKEGQVIKNVRTAVKEGQTTPPKHFTEDSLLAFMETAGNEFYDEDSDAEKKGIGTPATRASIIEKLVEKKFIKREKKNLIPTTSGEALVMVVPDNLKSAKLTAEWEMKLKDVELGNLSSASFMEQIESFTRDIVENFTQKNISVPSTGKSSGVLGKCPKCGEDVVKGKYGAYCKGKCGMYLSKVRGKELTDKQIGKLLSGESVTITIKTAKGGKGKFEVLPEIEDFSYTKDGKEISGTSFVSKHILSEKFQNTFGDAKNAEEFIKSLCQPSPRKKKRRD